MECLAHPGEILETVFLHEHGLTRADLAAHLQVPIEEINLIIDGEKDITPTVASGLAKVFNTTEQF